MMRLVKRMPPEHVERLCRMICEIRDEDPDAPHPDYGWPKWQDYERWAEDALFMSALVAHVFNEMGGVWLHKVETDPADRPENADRSPSG